MSGYEAVFLQVLSGMAQRARAVPTPGVAVVGVLERAGSLDWITAHRVVDRLTRAPDAGRPANFFAVAYAKAGEMMDTLKDSGGREPILGETGFRGGAILPHGAGYVLSAFSGGTSQQDYDIAAWAVQRLRELIPAFS